MVTLIDVNSQKPRVLTRRIMPRCDCLVWAADGQASALCDDDGPHILDIASAQPCMIPLPFVERYARCCLAWSPRS